MEIFLLLAVLLLLAGGGLLFYSRRERSAAGLPQGQVVYSDTGAWEQVEKPLRSRRYGLIGRPDYLVRHTENGVTSVIPVEVKSRRRPATPAASHLLQLAAYCLLVEETYNVRPDHGLLHYADATLQIPYTETLRRAVLDTAHAIRQGRHAADLHRDHTDAARCRGCGYRHACDEALV